MDLALNNLQWLICHKTRPTNEHLYQKVHYYHLYWSIEQSPQKRYYILYVDNPNFWLCWPTRIFLIFEV